MRDRQREKEREVAGLDERNVSTANQKRMRASGVRVSQCGEPRGTKQLVLGAVALPYRSRSV